MDVVHSVVALLGKSKYYQSTQVATAQIICRIQKLNSIASVFIVVLFSEQYHLHKFGPTRIRASPRFDFQRFSEFLKQ